MRDSLLSATQQRAITRCADALPEKGSYRPKADISEAVIPFDVLSAGSSTDAS